MSSKNSLKIEWNNHYDLVGEHSFLSPSKSAWLRYSDEKIIDVYENTISAQMYGTAMHELAKSHILYGIKMPRTSRTLDNYINDAIGYRMIPEQVLYYSRFAYGTADAIGCDRKKHILRIHDLKTGAIPVRNFEQLEIYAAYFFLEYEPKYKDINHEDYEIELRLYQNDEVRLENPDSSLIESIMDTVIHKSAVLEEYISEERFIV